RRCDRLNPGAVAVLDPCSVADARHNNRRSWGPLAKNTRSHWRAQPLVNNNADWIAPTFHAACKPRVIRDDGPRPDHYSVGLSPPLMNQPARLLRAYPAGIAARCGDSAVQRHRQL